MSPDPHGGPTTVVFVSQTSIDQHGNLRLAVATKFPGPADEVCRFCSSCSQEGFVTTQHTSASSRQGFLRDSVEWPAPMPHREEAGTAPRPWLRVAIPSGAAFLLHSGTDPPADPCSVLGLYLSDRQLPWPPSSSSYPRTLSSSQGSGIGKLEPYPQKSDWIFFPFLCVLGHPHCRRRERLRWRVTEKQSIVGFSVRSLHVFPSGRVGWAPGPLCMTARCCWSFGGRAGGHSFWAFWKEFISRGPFCAYARRWMRGWLVSLRPPCGGGVKTL